MSSVGAEGDAKGAVDPYEQGVDGQRALPLSRYVVFVLTSVQDTFLYRAAQAELKNQVQEDTREATLGQRSANARVHRKIELLRQSMNEDLEAAKTECVALP